ncbi:MAG: hypothetical protein LBG52_08310 [Candidatus Peribacteria bacterium]|nr:hypothetical protein [Candidatus Peribacteria bacterium]
MNVFLSVSQQAEENGVTLIAADASEEVEIVLAGEIPAEPERVEENVLPEEKELPVLPNTAVKNANLKGEISLEEQLTNIEIAENATTSALEDDEEIEIIFECETGDEITGDRIL